MRRFAFCLFLLLAACAGSDERDFESGLSERLGFAEIGAEQAVGYCSVAVAGDKHTGTIEFFTSAPGEEVEEQLVRAGGRLTSTERDAVVVTIGSTTYKIEDEEPTSVTVGFRERTEPASCPSAD